MTDPYAAPLVESLLKIDDPERRTQELLRLLVFKHAEMQMQICVAGLAIEDEFSHDKLKRERYAYAETICGYQFMDRSTAQMFWDAARKQRREEKTGARAPLAASRRAASGPTAAAADDGRGLV